MDEQTRHRLQAMTREFYQKHADAFDATRQRAWDGWEPLVDAVRAQFVGEVAMLDLGCGNARFLLYLATRGLVPHAYCGVDENAVLLARAQEQVQVQARAQAQAQARSASHARYRFVHGDLHATVLNDEAHEATYNLIVMFGVLHHVPGRQYRAELLRAVAKRLCAGGVLLLSFWQPGKRYSGASQPTPGLSFANNDLELEAHDLLLGWNGDFSVLRYCHDFTDEEIDEEIDGLEKSAMLRVLYRSQGGGNDRSNHYLALSRP